MRQPEKVRGGLLGGQLAWSSLFLVAFAGGLVGGSSTRLTALAAVGSVATICLLLLTVARYESMVALGFMFFGVLLVEPAVPDLIFGIVILVAILTGPIRSTLRRSPSLVVYALGSFIVLNVLAAAWAHSVGKAGSSYRSHQCTSRSLDSVGGLRRLEDARTATRGVRDDRCDCNRRSRDRRPLRAVPGQRRARLP